ncbi:MAG: GNAT family N-acetyltransferase, partial [Solirubrobacteraceae bacterium]
MTTTTELLDNPVLAGLHGAHARFALSRGAAVRYDPRVAPFVALPAGAGPDDWANLAALIGPEGFGVIVGDENAIPADWPVSTRYEGVQLVGGATLGRLDPELLTLGADDVPEMLALTEVTKPGPFFPRTHELGHYVGLRDGAGELVAMAGERQHPAGWTEISAVCTAASQRGRGLASRLINHLAAEITARGERPYLHAVSENVGAIRLYEALGFELRRPIDFT